MKNLIETVEKFLTYSDEKLEELSKKNQAYEKKHLVKNQNRRKK
ncbi:recombinase [Streptococcus mutans]|nr:recombinase [Streptococcus mutans]